APGRLALRNPFHLGLPPRGPAAPRPALREGQDLPVERPDRPALGHRRGPRAGGRRQPGDAWGQRVRYRRERDGLRALERSGLAAAGDREPELDALAVSPWGAGGVALHG